METFAPLNLTKEAVIEYTPEWTGDRAPDGRPLVSDKIIERMRSVTITQAWGVVRGDGYEHQYEGNWKYASRRHFVAGPSLHTCHAGPVMRRVMEEKGERLGQVGDQISWPIDALKQGDVYVADVFGKIVQGPVIGDNLAVAIYANSGNGVAHDAAVRDLEGIEDLKGFTSFVRGWDPSFASPTIMLAGMNCPIRIGQATCMPGDIVLGKREGVIFIPPHLAEKVVTTSEVIRLRDMFGKSRLNEGIYTPDRSIVAGLTK